jgi:hypothetical protein
MRITFLPVIIGFFLVFSVAISCFDSSEEVEYGSDDTIHAFELDTIYGINYSFTIDQINGRIFNIDSVPFTADTIINKILIKTLETDGCYVYKEDGALINLTDSFDLSQTMETPFKLRVVTPNREYYRDYTVEVRIHKQDPDSLVWKLMAPSFSKAGGEFGERKSVILGEKIVVYTYTSGVLKGYCTSLDDGSLWGKEIPVDLPAKIKLSSLLTCNDKLYALTEEGGDVYFSENGSSWSKYDALSDNRLEAFITGFPHTITGIRNEDGEKKFFCVTNSDFSGWEKGKEVPPTFPTGNISSTVYQTKTGVRKAFIVGETTQESSYTVPWFSIDGNGWTEAEAPVGNDGTTTYGCPYMSQPSILYYNDRFYVFGRSFDGFYTSPEGLTWSRVTQKMFFPKHSGETSDHPYSLSIDKDNFIWIIRGKEGEVWRGRINKFGFTIK